MRRTRIVELGWINMSAYNFVHSGPKFTIFLFNVEKIVLVKTIYIFCRYIYRFQRYLRSNSKAVINRSSDFFLPSQILRRGAVPQKLYLR